nr:MAG TPA: hypothetical protein [Caudoviricetes sp.]
MLFFQTKPKLILKQTAPQQVSKVFFRLFKHALIIDYLTVHVKRK